jgi:hypothetical protein
VPESRELGANKDLYHLAILITYDLLQRRAIIYYSSTRIALTVSGDPIVAWQALVGLEVPESREQLMPNLII